MDGRTALCEVPFVVVDLETTGGSPRASAVTEVGAVRVCGGEVVGELATLVDPGLTGTFDHPPIEAVLPAFLEFARGAVLVAHNARFDAGFLAAGLERLDYPPLAAPVVCTVTLARRLVGGDVTDLRLATLAHHLRCTAQPTHRALDDARATVEVFHRLLERAATFGVLTLDALLAFQAAPLRRAVAPRARAANRGW